MASSTDKFFAELGKFFAEKGRSASVHEKNSTVDILL